MAIVVINAVYVVFVFDDSTWVELARLNNVANNAAPARGMLSEYWKPDLTVN